MSGPRSRQLWIGALFVFALAAALPGLGRLRLDNAPERFLVRDPESVRRQEEFSRRFGSERRLWIVLTGPGLWTRLGLSALETVEREAASCAAVVRTAGLWSRHRWLLPAWPPEGIEAFRERALADPLSRSAGQLAEAGDLATVLVTLTADAGPAEVSELERRLRSRLLAGIELEITGLPVFERAMDDSQHRLVTVQLPALAALAATLLAAGFGSLPAAAAALCLVGVAVGGTLGALGYSGSPLDAISIVFVPLLFVIALATAVHLQAGVALRLEGGAPVPEAVAATLRAKGRAVLWTALTTAVAFASFAVNPLPPLRTLGLWLAAGLAWTLAASFGLYPILLTATGRSVRRAAGSLTRTVRASVAGLVRWTARRRRRVILAFLLVALAAATGAARVRSESQIRSYFATDHPARLALDRLEERGMAGAAADLLVRLPPGGADESGFRDPAMLDRLARLADRLRELPGVRGALGAGDLYRAALRDVVIEGEPSEGVRWMVLGLLQADRDGAATLDSLLADEGRTTRLGLLLPLRSVRELDPLLSAARRAALEAFPGATISIHGELPMLLDTQRHLLRTLSLSMALTLLAIVCILGAITRSVGATVRALTPNLWAVLVVFGVMGWAGVPLEGNTVMIAAVVLGLAVDDTLHTLAELRADSPGFAGEIDSPRLAAVLERVAPAHLLTSLVLVSGFAVCALSEFVPLARFGWLSAAGVGAALAGDLLLLPALLMSPRAGRGTPGRALEVQPVDRRRRIWPQNR